MRKFPALAFLSTFAAWPLAAQAPNPCEVFGRTVVERRVEYLLVSPFGDSKAGVSFGPVHAPALVQTAGEWFATAFGLVEVPARFQDRPNMNHATIPTTDGIEFVLSYGGTLQCIHFDLFRVRAGKVEFLFDEDGHGSEGCGGPIARPVLVAGTPYIVEASFVNGDQHRVKYPTTLEFFALARSEETLPGEKNLAPVCRLTFKHEVRTAFEPRQPHQWLDLQAHGAALARLNEKRSALPDILDRPDTDLAHVLGPDATRLTSARGTMAARFRASETEYRLTARREVGDVTLFRLRPLDGNRFFDLYFDISHPIVGYTVE
jgi:hypothetical protein